jgi:hypothetical protein
MASLEAVLKTILINLVQSYAIYNKLQNLYVHTRV